MLHYLPLHESQLAMLHYRSFRVWAINTPSAPWLCQHQHSTEQWDSRCLRSVNGNTGYNGMDSAVYYRLNGLDGPGDKEVK